MGDWKLQKRTSVKQEKPPHKSIAAGCTTGSPLFKFPTNWTNGSSPPLDRPLTCLPAQETLLSGVLDLVSLVIISELRIFVKRPILLDFTHK